MKTKFFLCILCMAAVFGCDDADPVIFKEPVEIDLGTVFLNFSSNASDTTLTSWTSAWSIYSFDMPHIPPNTVHPDDIILRENPTKGETLSYEWLERSTMPKAGLEAFPVRLFSRYASSSLFSGFFA
ncbi:MAG: hypothetical protein LBS42_11285 [Tannerella sp.]|nr:hypothetical protein [Tannerella sp.]